MTDEPRPEDTSTSTPAEAAASGATTTAEPVAEPSAEAKAEEEKKKPDKLKQEVEFKDIGPCKKHIKVTVDRAGIEAKLNEKFSELVKTKDDKKAVAVAGFRPGKAPRKIVERRFRKEVADQVKAEVLMQSLTQLGEDNDVAPLSEPDLDPTKIEIPETGPLIYEFDVEVRPQFDLPDYKGLKLKRPVKTFTDADVEREKRRLLEPYGQIVPKEPTAGQTEPTVETGDLVVADITTRDGERVLSELKEIRLRVEPRLAFKDGVAEKFAEQLQGAQPGQTRIVDITLSDSAADASLHNKTVQASFAIKDIKTVKLPAVTHELCHQFGVHSEEQLKELIKVVLDRRLEYHQRQSARQQVLARISAAAQWELPRDLLARQARNALNRRIMEMRSSGISEDEIKARMRLLQQDVITSTALALKEHFVLQKIAEVEKLEVKKEEIDAEIERLAAQYDEPPRRVRARLEKEEMMDALATELIERKALDLVLGSAEYEDVSLDATAEAAVATVEEQAVPGEMKDPTAAPAQAEEKPAEEAPTS
jgi:trigger factor